MNEKGYKFDKLKIDLIERTFRCFSESSCCVKRQAWSCCAKFAFGGRSETSIILMDSPEGIASPFIPFCGIQNDLIQMMVFTPSDFFRAVRKFILRKVTRVLELRFPLFDRILHTCMLQQFVQVYIVCQSAV